MTISELITRVQRTNPLSPDTRMAVVETVGVLVDAGLIVCDMEALGLLRPAAEDQEGIDEQQ